MLKFRFTLMGRVYFSASVQADTQAEARAKIEQMIEDDEIEINEIDSGSLEIVDVLEPAVPEETK